MVELYGSPNVFSQFQPHVTIAWASNATEVIEAFNKINVVPINFVPPSIGIGNVGPYGTVLDNYYGNFSLIEVKPSISFWERIIQLIMQHIR